MDGNCWISSRQPAVAAPARDDFSARGDLGKTANHSSSRWRRQVDLELLPAKAQKPLDADVRHDQTKSRITSAYIRPWPSCDSGYSFGHRGFHGGRDIKRRTHPVAVPKSGRLFLRHKDGPRFIRRLKTSL